MKLIINNYVVSFVSISIAIIFYHLEGWTPIVIYCLIIAIIYNYFAVPKINYNYTIINKEGEEK